MWAADALFLCGSWASCYYNVMINIVIIIIIIIIITIGMGWADKRPINVYSAAAASSTSCSRINATRRQRGWPRGQYQQFTAADQVEWLPDTPPYRSRISQGACRLEYWNVTKIQEQKLIVCVIHFHNATIWKAKLQLATLGTVQYMYIDATNMSLTYDLVWALCCLCWCLSFIMT